MTTSWTPRLPSPAARRRAGLVMLATSVVGLLVAISGTIVGVIVLGQVNTTTRDTVAVSIDSLDAVENTVDLADGLLSSTVEAVVAVEATLTTLADSVGTGAAAIDSVGELSSTASPALRDAEATLRDLEAVGITIDGALNALSQIPFGPDYEPEAGFGETMGRLADDIAPLPAAFDQTATSLAELSVGSAELEDELTELAVSVADISERLESSDDLVAEYRANLDNARTVAEQSQDDLGGNLTLGRWLIVIAGLNFALAQLVPFWYGRQLLGQSQNTTPAQ